ncbi:hypothetical protein [Paenibacillus sp. V4I5]|nr:hypothetical protein [Paenibacillus sp. V4I5]MDQ0913862.1 hypothetical protein [Paenibacillus sp. V4I5]
MKLDDNVTNYILDVLGDYCLRCEGNKQIQDYTNDVANALHKAVGRPEV